MGRWPFSEDREGLTDSQMEGSGKGACVLLSRYQDVMKAYVGVM